MIELLLSPSHTCLIDEPDSSLVKQFKWSVISRKEFHKYYAISSIGGRLMSMHRLIMSAQKGQIVDHINGNGLDNRRKNLRFCTNAENVQNSSGWNKKLARHTQEHPVYKGVWGIKRCTGRHGGRIWEAKLCFAGKQRYIGAFDLPELAAMAYDDWARCFHGRFARLNFPEKGEIGVHETPKEDF